MEVNKDGFFVADRKTGGQRPEILATFSFSFLLFSAIAEKRFAVGNFLFC